MDLRFSKIVGQIVCVELDDGEVVNERSIGDFVAHRRHLATLEQQIDDAVAQVQTDEEPPAARPRKPPAKKKAGSRGRAGR